MVFISSSIACDRLEWWKSHLNRLMFLTIVICCITAHQRKVRAQPSSLAASILYSLVLNDLWFGSWIRVSSQSPLC